ncbi:hypothetical protein DFO45_4436 [Azorhizobium sp. AG788]|uniref:hypothetical protein n=1 Tax=Azorhizobium sp. AG788 TaxID=2183897 RepID=UPI0010CF19F7|nr:hypothetical protein [Azorhizobium sp. AG788]TDT89515.1 hypothetical protein DFO45_4436 [Azorhizobium sp. AG788]
MTYHAPATAAARLFIAAARHAPAGLPGPLTRMLLKIAVLAPLVIAAFALRYAAFA